MMKKVEAFYRESGVRTYNSSASSSIVQISSNHTNDHVSLDVTQCDPHQQTLNDIADKLSKLKINVDRQPSIILAGNSPRESEFQRSIDSFNDWKHSNILAGRLDDIDLEQDSQNVTVYSEKAMNESLEHNKGILEISLQTDDGDIDIGLHSSELSYHADGHKIYRQDSLNPSNWQPQQNVTYQEAYQTDQTFKILFQQFLKAPKRFTEQLVTALEEFVPQPTLEETNMADFSVNGLGEKFEKIRKQYCEKIDDETMPDLGVSHLHFFSLLADENFGKSTSGSADTTCRREIASLLQDVTKPKSANGVNEAHRSRLQLSLGTAADEHFDTTCGFETLEKLCRSISPTKQKLYNSLHIRSSCTASCKKLLEKQNDQMAARRNGVHLIKDVGEHASQDKNTPIILLNSKNATEKFAKDLTSPILVESSRTKIKIDQQNSDSCKKPYADEIREILNARLVEKRKKCFEATIKGCETQKSPTISKTSGSLSKVMDKKDISDTSGHNRIFLNTMSACMDYFQDLQAFRSYRNSLECVPENTRETESMKNSIFDSKSVEFVETFLVPAQNRAHYQLNVGQSSKTSTPDSGAEKTNYIAETYICLPGNTQNPTAHTGIENSQKNNTRSSTCKASPTTRARHLSLRKNKILGNKDVQPCLHSNFSRTPRSERLPSQLPVSYNSPILTGLNLENDSLNYIDVRNPDKFVNTPPIITITNTSSSRDSPHKWNRLNNLQDKTAMIDSKHKLSYSNNATPKSRRKKKIFLDHWRNTDCRKNMAKETIF